MKTSGLVLHVLAAIFWTGLAIYCGIHAFRLHGPDFVLWIGAGAGMISLAHIELERISRNL